MDKGLMISWETADNITVDNLHDVYINTRHDLEKHARGDMWMHDDDIKANRKLLKAVKRVLKYYGKDVDTARLSEW